MVPNEITHSTWTWLLVGLPALVACGCGHDAAAPTGLSEVQPHEQSHGRPTHRAGEAQRQPFLEILKPASGDTLAGATTIELDYFVPATPVRVEFGFGEPLVEGQGMPHKRIGVDTSRMRDGDYRYTVRLTLASGKRLEAHVDVKVDNPDHRLARYEANQDRYAAGETVVLSLEYGRPSLRLAADFKDVDPGFDSGREHVADLGDGLYRVTYALSATAVGDRRGVVVVRAVNADGEVTTNPIELTLANTPHMPIVVRGGILMAAARIPVQVIPQHAPQIVPIDLPASISTGTEVILKLRLQDRGKGASNRVVIGAEGYSDVYIVLVKKGQSQMAIPIAMPKFKPSQAGLPIHLRVAALNAAGWTSAWVERPITARP